MPTGRHQTPLSMEQRLEMAVEEGSRVLVLGLRLLLEELGTEPTREMGERLSELPAQGFDAVVRDQMAEVFGAVTWHVEAIEGEVGPEGTVEERWRAAMQVGARSYAMLLRLLLEELGEEETRALADRMDELSVEGADVFGIREDLGLPPKQGEGDMEDWANFMGTAWSIIADPNTDWEWAEFTPRRSVLRVSRCPYWEAMTEDVRAINPCEVGCSTYIDVAAQRVNPRLRLRGDPTAAEAGLGYPRSKPKGDPCCDLTVEMVD